jgi:ABC-2 type transport system ATP-binding protein
MDAIRVDALTKHYTSGFWRPRPYVALDALTLQVHQGEVFGFLGPNGAGKTTTLKLLMRLIFPTSGSAEILGKPLGDIAVKRRIGYLPENPYFYDHLTAEELLEYFAGLFGLDSRRARAQRLLDEVGIGAERRLQLRKFSKGMLQRVGIAQALINEPELVFFDEPMSGLDPIGRREIRELILRLRDRGCTVFFSSHVLSDAETLCSRVAMLAGGRLVAVDSLRELNAFRIRGWEVVVSGMTDANLQQLTRDAIIVRSTRLGEERHAVEVPPSTTPEAVLPALTSGGAHVVSLQPLRDTLEDLFIQKVRGAETRRGVEGA